MPITLDLENEFRSPQHVESGMNSSCGPRTNLEKRSPGIAA